MSEHTYPAHLIIYSGRKQLLQLGIILKIESETQEGLNKALELLSVDETENIEKNAAELLAEKLNLI